MYRRHLGHSRVKNLFKFVSAKMDTVFTVESALEFDACFHLEYSHDITSYEAQPEGFIYQFNGRSCPYTPDFKINHSVNGIQFLEIKPIEKTNDADFIERFKAKRTQSTQNGLPLILVTEKQIRINPILYNLKLLHRYSGSKHLTSVQIYLLSEVKKLGKVSIEFLINNIKTNEDNMFSLILNLLAKGYLRSNITDNIFNINTTVWCKE